MKIFLGMVVIIGSLVSLEWAALNSIVNAISVELAQKRQTVQVVGENPPEGFVSGYRLSTQHLQPAYNTVQRTQGVQ